MTQYVSKPATVEAWRYNGRVETAVALAERVNGSGFGPVDEAGDRSWIQQTSTHPVALFVQTNNGPAEVRPGHYLIRGVDDFYPCDPETFATRWEEDEDEVFDHEVIAIEGGDDEGHYASVRLAPEDALRLGLDMATKALSALMPDTTETTEQEQQ